MQRRPLPFKDEIHAEIEKIRNAPYNNLSIPQTAQTGGGGNPSLTVKNETEFELHILLYGPTTRGLSRFPPTNLGTLHLLAGDYEVAARFSGGNVRTVLRKD